MMHQKCNIPVALPSVLIIEGNEGGTLCVCLTSELEMGCMVPCSRMEEEEKEEEAQLAAEGE